jgi:predicted permease
MNRVRSMLAVGEISTAVVLLIGAGLLLASLYRLNKVQPGFDPTNVLTFKINLTQSSYDTLEKTQQFYDELQRRLMSIPGVKSAGMISVMPVEQYGVNGPVEIVGLPYNAQYQSPTVEMRSVSTNYFQTLGIPVVSGRDIAPSDNAQSQKVVVVNEAFQRVFFGGESALGRIIGPNAKEGYIIVGVVKDIHQSGLVRDPMPEAYYPYAQDQDNRAAVVVKTSGDPLSIVSQVREQVRSIDARQAIFDPDNFENVISRSLSNNKLNATLMSVFAGIATILAAIGIFGVMSYLVTQHTREIGIRMALGAQRSDVLRMVVGQGMVLTLIALGIGSVLSLMTSRALTSLLFGVKPLHLGVYAAVEVGLLLVAAFSCLFPAMRATRVDPMVALRQAE